jgi:glyoxylase-like metal-dependent hydrolase (beta-lactamase superfamily II)
MRGSIVVRTGAPLAAALCWTCRLWSQSPLAIRTETVAPGYVVISGYTNGNILAVIGDSGVLLVDAQSARRVPQADSALRTFTGRPVRWVISTHYHGDHIEGNAYWRARGAEVVGHERIPVEAGKDTTIAELAWHRTPAAPDALPTRTFRDSLRLRLPMGDVVVAHTPAAHTGGDAVVWLPQANVLHLGDILELGAPPFVDWWAGGTLDGMIAAVDAVLPRVNDRTRIIPGHGPVTDRAGLLAYRDMLATIRDRMVGGLATGRTRESLPVLDIVAGFVERLGGERRARQFVEALYPGVRRPAGAPQPISRGGFVVRLGTDTLAVERFERYADRMEGTLVRRSPETRLHRYVVTLGPDDRPVRFDDSISRRTGTPLPTELRAASVLFGPDTATITLLRDTAVARRVPAARGYPALPESFALYEVWLSAMRRTGDTVAHLVAPVGGPAGRLRLRPGLRDTVLIPIIGGAFVARADEVGRLLELDGSATTLKYRVTRVEDLPIERLAASFAWRDSTGAGLGAWVSGRDTVVGTVGSARVWIDYGRPAKRGREIFSRGVLGDTVWRTGANAATQLEVSQPVQIGGQPLAAGRYSLWTHFRMDGSAELIVNGQSGQWGTQYDPGRDVLRVPLRGAPLEPPVEVFTVALEASGQTVRLSLRWDRTELSVELRPAP